MHKTEGLPTYRTPDSVSEHHYQKTTTSNTIIKYYLGHTLLSSAVIEQASLYA